MQLELPGGGCMRAKIGVHSGKASDSLVGCSNTLHYRCGVLCETHADLDDVPEASICRHICENLWAVRFIAAQDNQHVMTEKNNMLIFWVRRLCGPACDVARQLAGCASWGSMLVSEEVWQNQGERSKVWVYNQGVSMPWGPISSCFTLLPEGQAAYLHSATAPSCTPSGMPFLQAVVQSKWRSLPVDWSIIVKRRPLRA